VKDKEKVSEKATDAKASPPENTQTTIPAGQNSEELKTQVAQLQALVDKLNARVEELEKHPERAKAKKSKGSKAAKKDSAETKKTEVAKHRRKGPTITGGVTPLLFAARDGHMEAARALVESGADVNDPGKGEKIPPLVMAIANGHYDLGKYLLDHGADAKVASDAGLTPLYATIDMQWAPYAWLPQPIIAQEKTSYLELMTALLDHGADPNARLKQKVWFRALAGDNAWVDPAGATAFWRAAEADDLAAMRLLMAHGANPNTPTDKGVTPLMVTAGLGWAPNFSRNAPDSWMAAVKYCLELGADINAQDLNGYTVLHGVAFRGDNEMINFLVEKGAKVDFKTKKGDTIADMANGPFQHSIPHAETVALLEKLGSANSHNCRSDQCVPNTIEDKKPVASEQSASAKPAKPAPK
jgi:ankyrin repeat protein